ncbi:MAG: hypothetical protein M3541_15545 [Acidobacteriota bacterium]|nr:hypothetical protein [Acidobacteriota bacterium]
MSRLHRRDRNPGGDQHHRLADHKPEDVRPSNAQRHPDTQLADAAGDAVGDGAVEAQAREQKRDRTKDLGVFRVLR